METKTCGECKHYLAKMFHCKKNDVMSEAHQTCEDFEQKKKKTNGDKIRSMSDEELAVLLNSIDYTLREAYKDEERTLFPCVYDLWLTYLKQEAKDEN
jgi:hypothetical protein